MTPSQTVPSFTNAAFDQRMAALKQIAQVTGIRLPNTIIPEGESLIPYGEERQRALKEEIYSLPTIIEAHQTLRDIRKEQDPIDVKVPLQKVRMSPVNAGLYGEGSEGSSLLSYTATAFNQVATTIKPASVTAGFASTLLALPPAIRSDAFNHFANQSIKDNPVVLRLSGKTMVAGASRFASVGLSTRTFWRTSGGGLPRSILLIGSRTTTGTTSRVTFGGQRQNNRRETLGKTCTSPIAANPNYSSSGLTSST